MSLSVIIILIWFVGFVAGLAVSVAIIGFSKIGWLVVDRSIPDENPYLFLELSETVDILSKKKYAILKVINKDYLPQD